MPNIYKGRDPSTRLKRAPNVHADHSRCYHDYIHIGGRADQAKMDVISGSEIEHLPRSNVRGDFGGIDFRLHLIGH